MTGLLTRLKTVLPKGQFARNVTVLAGGTAFGQGLVVLASPLLTRLYLPEDFGVLAVYSAILGIIAVVASLRYELAIPLPEDDGAAANLLGLSLTIVIGASVLSALGVLVWGEILVTWLNAAALAPYLWLLPIGVLLTGSYQVLNYWAVREKAFSSIARTKLSQGMGSVFTQVGLGLLGLGPVGLITGQVVGQTAGSTTLATIAWRRSQSALKQLSLSGMAKVAKRYHKFPMFSSLSGFANVLSLQAAVLLLSSFYDPVVTGLYALSHRVLQLPMGIVGSAVSQVFYREAVKAARAGDLPRLVKSTYKNLALIAAVPFTLMLVLAPDLFGLVFGEDWREAGSYTRVLLPWLFLMFLNSPITALIAIFERQQIYLLYDALLLASRIGALYLSAVYVGDPLASLAWYGMVGLAFNLGLFFYLLNLSRRTYVA